MSGSLLIYGANGFVGANIAREAARMGLHPLLAGRNGARVQALAGELGCEARAFVLREAAGVDAALDGVAVVLNCAGPFVHTAPSLASACLRKAIPYLDITGEIPVFEALQARDAEAKARGVMLLPGVGFDVAPTDCLALHLKSRLPGATRLRLAFQASGPAGAPPGTQRTAIEMLPHGDRVRVGGRLIRPTDGAKSISVDFGEGPVKVRRVPWGDVFTAWFNTGIPDIEDYMAFAPAMERQVDIALAIAPLLRFAPVRALAKLMVQPGPNPEARSRSRTHVWGEVADPEGRTATARLHGPEAGVEWTTATALAAARKALNGSAPAGYQTPAKAYGADFILEGKGVTREDLP